jgi:hypothetical protein
MGARKSAAVTYLKGAPWQSLFSFELCPKLDLSMAGLATLRSEADKGERQVLDEANARMALFGSQI